MLAGLFYFLFHSYTIDIMIVLKGADINYIYHFSFRNFHTIKRNIGIWRWNVIDLEIILLLELGTARWANVRSENCSSGNYPSGNCPGTYFSLSTRNLFSRKVSLESFKGFCRFNYNSYNPLEQYFKGLLVLQFKILSNTLGPTSLYLFTHYWTYLHLLWVNKNFLHCLPVFC